MRVLLVTVLALCLLALAARADDGFDSVAVVVVTDPPGATVYLDPKGSADPDELIQIGPTNGPSLIFRYPHDQTTVSLVLEKPGCVQVRHTMDVLRIKRENLNTWPPEGPIRLPYLNGFEQMKAWLGSWQLPLLLALGLTGGGAALVVLRARRQAARAAAEQALARTVTGLVVPTGSDLSMVGRHLGSYLLVERLGQGGMATVYRAFPEDRVKDDREAVAIKILDPELAQDKEFLRRLNREKEVYQALRHPNIVQVLGSGSYGEHYYLVMELVKGSTLRDRLKPAGLPPEEVLRLVAPVLQALAFAHEKGIVHRDLKPENVMVTDTGQVKVMDFGMARGQQYSTVTRTGSLLGTPAYMAPEQIQGQLDPRSDQYAAGVMIYEMLCGRPPFMDENPVTIILRHLSETPVPLVELRPELAAVSEVVQRMMAREPDLRFPDLKEALQALRGALQT